MNIPRGLLLSVAGLIPAGLAGCSENKLTRQNFDMIRENVSTKLEVEHTLGSDYTARGPAGWEYEDPKRGLTVYVHFDEQDRVVRKEWIDARAGRWEGAAPGIREPSTPPERSSTTTIRED